MNSSGLSDPPAGWGGRVGRIMAAGLLVVLGLLVADLVERRESEARAGLSPGPGLIVGVEASSELEHRGQPLSRPLVLDRREPLRAGAVALCALGLLLAVWPRRGAPGGVRAWARWLWAGPGAVGIHRLVEGGAGRDGGLGLAALLLVLSLSLLAAWRD